MTSRAGAAVGRENALQRRSPSLRAQLAIAFLAVALVSVAIVAFWANRITAQQIAAYHDRIRRGDAAWVTDSPPGVREVFLRNAKPKHFVAAQRRFLAGFNRSLWFGGATASLLALVAGMVLSRRFAQPLRELQGAASGIAAGDLQQAVPPRGGSELEDVAEAFNAMAARLQESERLRHALLAAVAHELRTPLAIIQGNLEALMLRTAEPTPERLSALYTQGALLNRLITDLRDLSLAEAGQLQLHRRPTDLAMLFREAVDVMRPWIDERKVRVEFEAAEPVVVNADPDRMRQVIHNLLHNAIRFSPASGEVRARAAAVDASSVEVVIDDNGAGIAADDLPWVFEPFYRADPSRSRASGGMGLGLTVVKQLVAAHGGDVHVENRAEGGSRFTVRLPIREV